MRQRGEKRRGTRNNEKHKKERKREREMGGKMEGKRGIGGFERVVNEATRIRGKKRRKAWESWRINATHRPGYGFRNFIPGNCVVYNF